MPSLSRLPEGNEFKLKEKSTGGIKLLVGSLLYPHLCSPLPGALHVP